LREVPVPRCGCKRILGRTRASLVSIGTEWSTIELGRKSLAGKAAARPDLVRRAWEKAKKEGLLKTYKEAMGRLDTPTPLGYSCAGVVEECGLAATEFSPGDRVACIGQGFAGHAEFVSIPVNLACRIPDGVPEEEAAFGMLGIIALHGIRCANLSFGSHVVVMGLGFAAMRDAISFFRYDSTDDFGNANPLEFDGLPSIAIALGVSQSGRFLRDFLYQGFNEDVSGRIVFDGEPLEKLAGRKRDRKRGRDVGFIFQQFNLLAGRTALENVMTPLLYASGRQFWRRKVIAAEMLERVGQANVGEGVLHTELSRAKLLPKGVGSRRRFPAEIADRAAIDSAAMGFHLVDDLHGTDLRGT